MPWIFAEDAALKAKLSGLTVTDVTAPGGRRVAVRFRLPETELADLTFPCVIIDHVSVLRDTEREHRGITRLPYAPEGVDGVPDAKGLYPFLVDYPIPYDINYQITVLSRKAPHHLALVGALAKLDRLPTRFGYLEIPGDGTIRRLDLDGGPELSSAPDGEGKRLFEATYLISVSTELLLSDVRTFTKVLEVAGHIKDKDTGLQLSTFSDTYDVPIGTP